MTPIILSGGVGSRLWPASRTNLPKQFSPLWKPTLFEQTLSRLQSFGDPIVVSHVDQKNLCKSFLDANNYKGAEIIAEPVAKNTAPAVAVAALDLLRKGMGDAIAGVFPSDHLVTDVDAFNKVVELAIKKASESGIVTLGIEPTYASTGYGYIETQSDSENGVCKVVSFHEKPDEVTASSFIEKGDFYWNAGMFIFKVNTVVEAFEKHMPSLWKDLQGLSVDGSNFADVYDKITGQSFDYGIMEFFEDSYCIPVEMGWSDVGSWDEVVKSRPASDVIEVDGANNSVIGSGKTAAFVGLDDLVAVDSENALLVFRKGDSQRVKEVYQAIQESDRSDLTSFQNMDFRPWGSFEVLRDEPHFKSKIIRVNPGQQLSYQSHKKRAEHWVIVKGEGEVVLNDEIHKVSAGESIFIPLGAKHRMRNSSESLLEFVEVQVGTYFGEDDITRYEDDYSRT